MFQKQRNNTITMIYRECAECKNSNWKIFENKYFVGECILNHSVEHYTFRSAFPIKFSKGLVITVLSSLSPSIFNKSACYQKHMLLNGPSAVSTETWCLVFSPALQPSCIVFIAHKNLVINTPLRIYSPKAAKIVCYSLNKMLYP